LLSLPVANREQRGRHPDADTASRLPTAGRFSCYRAAIPRPRATVRRVPAGVARATVA